MERLTLVVPDNGDIWLLREGEPYLLITSEDDNYDEIKRLSEYEDLGLTPDQLKDVDKLYTEKCKRISSMSRHIVEKLDDAKPPYNRILDSLEENKMKVGQISGLNKAIKIVQECMENMDKEEYRDVCEPEYLSDSVATGCRYGLCRCGTPVMSIHNFCMNCGVKLEWGGVHG